jgi:hypothetical protein
MAPVYCNGSSHSVRYVIADAGTVAGMAAVSVIPLRSNVAAIV